MKNKRSKALALLVAAERELSAFRSKPQFSTLSQACEKTWVAFTLLLELKAGRELKTSAALRSAAKELRMRELFARTRILHVFHYEGSVALGYEEMAGDVEELIPEIRAQIEGG